MAAQCSGSTPPPCSRGPQRGYLALRPGQRRKARAHLPYLMTLPYPAPRARLGQAQLCGELGRRAVDEAVGERCEKRVAGVRRAEQPLAHRQRLSRGRGDHVAGAGIQEDPAAAGVSLSAKLTGRCVARRGGGAACCMRPSCAGARGCVGRRHARSECACRQRGPATESGRAWRARHAAEAASQAGADRARARGMPGPSGCPSVAASLLAQTAANVVSIAMCARSHLWGISDA
jgi:hypothetical protein